MSSFYLCSRFSRRAELQQCRAALKALGHVVTSSWIDIAEEDPTAAVKCAKQDIADIRAADTLIAFTDTERSPWTRGGRHYEAGFGFAVGKRLMLVGPVENIFYSLPEWQKFASFDDVLVELRNSKPKPQKERVVKRILPKGAKPIAQVYVYADELDYWVYL
jgi:nucleoside 2-deoxyribosyltransferase